MRGAVKGDERLRAIAGLQDHRLADQMISIAETQSSEALAIACGSALRELTGSATVGLYLLHSIEPDLVYSQHVAEDFLDNYRSSFWKSDPVLDSILTQERTVDGASLLGSYGWSRSQSFRRLRHWGFSFNMGGPLRCCGKTIGVLFTATRGAEAYTPLQRRRMEMLCRAASLALADIQKTGEAPIRTCQHASGATHGCPVPLSIAALNNTLPPRSADVAIWVCRGQTNKQIAREMRISDQTVKEHVANLCKRFGVHNRTELVAFLLTGGSVA